MKKGSRVLSVLVVLGLLVLAACKGGGGGGAAYLPPDSGKSTGKNSIAYAVIYSAPAGSCPNGGITVYAGIDTNGNGVLDPAEYTGSPQYVCNGTNGLNGNNWPIANAGPDQKVAEAGIEVTLDGSGSSDPDGGTPDYAWSFKERPVGSLAQLSSAVVSNPTFIADKAGKYEISLLVSDGTATSLPDTVIVRAGMPVPDTGQTRFYSTVFGDDGDYQINPPSYTDNGDGTILDNVTGLTWQKCPVGLSELDCATGTAATYNWWEATGTYNATYNSNTENACGSLGGGWRLPTDYELTTIVDFGRYNRAIDSAYFPNALSSYYWSSTASANSTNHAFYVDFDSGSTIWFNKASSYYVRCVRGQ